MLVQILASSASTGEVWRISAPKISNSSAALGPDPAPTPPMIVGSVSISSTNLFAAIRSGTCATKKSSPTVKPCRDLVRGAPPRHGGDKEVLPDREAAALLDVARQPLGGARRDGGAQDQRL